MQTKENLLIYTSGEDNDLIFKIEEILESLHHRSFVDSNLFEQVNYLNSFYQSIEFLEQLRFVLGFHKPGTTVNVLDTLIRNEVFDHLMSHKYFLTININKTLNNLEYQFYLYNSFDYHNYLTDRPSLRSLDQLNPKKHSFKIDIASEDYLIQLENGIKTLFDSTNFQPISKVSVLGFKDSPNTVHISITDTIIITGQHSKDEEIPPENLTFKWRQLLNKRDETLLMNKIIKLEKNGMTQTIFFSASGYYSIGLTVNDGIVDSKEDTLHIEVYDPIELFKSKYSFYQHIDRPPVQVLYEKLFPKDKFQNDASSLNFFIKNKANINVEIKKGNDKKNELSYKLIYHNLKTPELEFRKDFQENLYRYDSLGRNLDAQSYQNILDTNRLKLFDRLIDTVYETGIGHVIEIGLPVPTNNKSFHKEVLSLYGEYNKVYFPLGTIEINTLRHYFWTIKSKINYLHLSRGGFNLNPLSTVYLSSGIDADIVWKIINIEIERHDIEFNTKTYSEIFYPSNIQTLVFKPEIEIWSNWKHRLSLRYRFNRYFVKIGMGRYLFNYKYNDLDIDYILSFGDGGLLDRNSVFRDLYGDANKSKGIFSLYSINSSFSTRPFLKIPVESFVDLDYIFGNAEFNIKRGFSVNFGISLDLFGVFFSL